MAHRRRQSRPARFNRVHLGKNQQRYYRNNSLVRTLIRGNRGGGDPPPIPTPEGATQGLFYDQSNNFVGLDRLRDHSTSGDARPKQPGRAILLNGTNYIGSAAFDKFDNDFSHTIAIWFKPTSYSVDDFNYILCTRIANNNRINIGYRGDLNRFGVNCNNPANSTITRSTTAASTIIPVGEWHFLVTTWDPSGILRLFVDDVEITGSNAIGVGSNTDNQMRIGADSASGNTWDGALFDFKLFDRILTDAEATALYNQGLNPRRIQTDAPTDHVFGHYFDDHSLVSAADNVGNYTGTIFNGVAGQMQEDIDVPWSPQNLIGYTDGAGDEYYPYKPGGDYSGRVPRMGRPHSSNGGSLNGVVGHFDAPHLVGTETVISSGGTSTPAVSAGRIDFTLGTCWDIVLSDGTHYPISEGFGSVMHDTSPGANHADLLNLAEATFWAATQDEFHRNLIEGFSFYEHATTADLRVPFSDAGNPIAITPPAGYSLSYQSPAVGNNNPETLIDFTDAEPNAPWLRGNPTIETAYAFGTVRTDPNFKTVDSAQLESQFYTG